jgi:hypothetical protein
MHHSNEAAECIIQYLLDNYEEEFQAVSAKNNVALRSTKNGTQQSKSHAS